MCKTSVVILNGEQLSMDTLCLCCVPFKFIYSPETCIWLPSGLRTQTGEISQVSRSGTSRTRPAFCTPENNQTYVVCRHYYLIPDDVDFLQGDSTRVHPIYASL